MSDSLSAWQDRKTALLRKISVLGDFRPGSITPTTGRCGNSHCHCHQPADPGQLKQSGMFWTVRGANAIIALRCCRLSGRFEDYWEARRG